MTDAKPTDIPPVFKDYALVTGKISSAPLDLANRMDAVYAALKKDGWRVAVRSIGTDFAGPLGVPVPRDQPIELYLKNLNGPTTAASAEAEMSKVLNALSLGYSPIARWEGEVIEQVVKPTIQQIKVGLPYVPWLIGGAVLLVLLSRRR